MWMIGLPLIEVSLDSWNAAATRNEGVIVSPYKKKEEGDGGGGGGEAGDT